MLLGFYDGLLMLFTPRGSRLPDRICRPSGAGLGNRVDGDGGRARCTDRRSGELLGVARQRLRLLAGQSLPRDDRETDLPRVDGDGDDRRRDRVCGGAGAVVGFLAPHQKGCGRRQESLVLSSIKMIWAEAHRELAEARPPASEPRPRFAGPPPAGFQGVRLLISRDVPTNPVSYCPWRLQW